MRLFRTGNYLYNKKIPFIPKVMNFLIRLCHNSAVFSETSIGKNTNFAYGGIGVVIHKRAVIGENCMIGSNVTIGGRSKSKDVPRIGNNVYIATGAKILGNITIADGCVIGANAVVICDVPQNSIVAGIPARIIKTNINAKDYY